MMDETRPYPTLPEDAHLPPSHWMNHNYQCYLLYLLANFRSAFTGIQVIPMSLEEHRFQPSGLGLESMWVKKIASLTSFSEMLAYSISIPSPLTKALQLIWGISSSSS